MMNREIVFSVQTCTFNRRDTLVRTYESLRDQTYRHFEWIVYDNGSTDDTISLVRQWEKEADFPIVVMRREDNAAIQLSWNEGVRIARGKFWTLLDSDDACKPNALQGFLDAWELIPVAERSKFVGVACSCVDQHGNRLGELLPTNPLDCSTLELAYKYKIKSEKWGVMRLDVMREFPFPDVNDHIIPGVIWRAIGRDYLTRYFNDTLRIYYINEGDRTDQMSFHQKASVVAPGKRLSNLELLNNDIKWLYKSPVDLLKSVVRYSQTSSFLEIGLVAQLREVKPIVAKGLVLMFWPLGKYWEKMPRGLSEKLR